MDVTETQTNIPNILKIVDIERFAQKRMNKKKKNRPASSSNPFIQ